MSESAYIYGNLKLGRGHFDLPPVLIGTLFYKGETIIDRNNPELFSEKKAKNRINNHKKLATQYHLPEMIEITADGPKSMKKYLEFYLDNYNTPFVLGGNFNARVEGIEYLNERGIKPTEYIYNTISNLNNSKEIEIIKKNKINSVVVLILGSENMTSTQRYNYLIKKRTPNNLTLIDAIKNLGVEKIWIDGGVINLESLASILETQQIVSKSLYLPVGTAPNLFLFRFSSPKLNKKYHTRYRRASIMFISTWVSNFIFYGAIEDATESFASVYQAFKFKKIVKNKNIKILDY